jgi:hypothetical protein
MGSTAVALLPALTLARSQRVAAQRDAAAQGVTAVG